MLDRLMQQMVRVTPLVLANVPDDDGSFTNLFHAGLFASIRSQRTDVLYLLANDSRRSYDRLWNALVSTLPEPLKQVVVDHTVSGSPTGTANISEQPRRELDIPTSLHRFNPQSSSRIPLPLLALTKEIESFERRQLNTATSSHRITPQFNSPFQAATHWHTNRLLEDGPLERPIVWVTENNQNRHFTPYQLRLLRRSRWQWERDHPNDSTVEDVKNSTQLPSELKQCRPELVCHWFRQERVYRQCRSRVKNNEKYGRWLQEYSSSLRGPDKRNTRDIFATHTELGSQSTNTAKKDASTSQSAKEAWQASQAKKAAGKIANTKPGRAAKVIIQNQIALREEEDLRTMLKTVAQLSDRKMFTLQDAIERLAVKVAKMPVSRASLAGHQCLLTF